MKTCFFKGQQLGKETQKGIFKTPRKKRSNINEHGHCKQWISKEHGSQEDSCSFKHDVNTTGTKTRRKSRSQSQKKRHSRGTEKEISKTQDPKVPDLRESQINRSARISNRGNAKKKSTCVCWHPAGMGTRAHRQSQCRKHGEGTIAIKSDETKEFNCVLAIQLRFEYDRY